MSGYRHQFALTVARAHEAVVAGDLKTAARLLAKALHVVNLYYQTTGQLIKPTVWWKRQAIRFRAEMRAHHPGLYAEAINVGEALADEVGL